MKAIIYLRISTEKQASGQSLAHQESACRLKAKLLGIHAVEIFSDIISGASAIYHRPGLTDALLSLHKNDTFIAYAPDRIARDIGIAFMVQTIIKKLNAHLVYAIEAPKTISTTMLEYVAAHKKRSLIKKATQKSLRQKRKKRRRCGTIPFGYCLASDGIHIKKDPREQRTIKLIAAARNAHVSYREIALRLHEKGYLNRKGNPFTANQLQKIKSKAHAIAPAARNATFGFETINNTLAACHYEQHIIFLVKNLRAKGLSLRKIVTFVNECGYRNRKNNLFQLTQIARIAKRHEL